MIGRLSGILALKKPPFILLDVGGVGYEVQLPMNSFYNLGNVGSKVDVITHLVIKEDSHSLYGFSDFETRTIFRELIKINGIGAVVALGILSALSISDLINIIKLEDVTRLTKIPKIGKKTAERLIIELRDRIQKLDLDNVDLNASNSADVEAIEALVTLGYKQNIASNIVKKIIKSNSNLSVEDIIKEALKNL